MRSALRQLFPLPGSSHPAYCWVIVLAGFFGLLACLGIGRFSLGMLLPDMGAGLGLSYSQMGLISTANFCGYLGAVLFCSWGISLLGSRLLIFLALLLVGATMILVSTVSSLLLIILLYGLTGAGSALANVPVMALISTWFAPKWRGRAAGLCIMGNGLGILISARLVPLLGEAGGDWRSGWLVLGALVMAIAFFCLLLIRNEPGNGKSRSTAPLHRPGGLVKILGLGYRRAIFHCAAIYLLFGLSYVIYITFMVTALVEERGLSEQQAGEIWSWVGILSLGSGPIFGYISDRFTRKRALFLVFCFQAAAYGLAAIDGPMATIYMSIILFGMVAFAVPTIIAALVGDYAGATGAAAAFGFVTFIFGCGQIAGPAVAGILAERTGTFSPSFFLAAGAALLAIILSCLLPPKILDTA